MTSFSNFSESRHQCIILPARKLELKTWYRLAKGKWNMINYFNEFSPISLNCQKIIIKYKNTKYGPKKIEKDHEGKNDMWPLPVYLWSDNIMVLSDMEVTQMTFNDSVNLMYCCRELLLMYLMYCRRAYRYLFIELAKDIWQQDIVILKRTCIMSPDTVLPLKHLITNQNFGLLKSQIIMLSITYYI